MIVLRNVSKVYEVDGIKTQALEGVSLTIDNGEFVAIMGSSGSGKTTLLNILGGIETVSFGEYEYDDMRIHMMKQREIDNFRKDKVSFVVQSFALMSFYTVFGNIEMPLLVKRVGRKRREELIQDIADKLGITDILKKLPSHISGGQQQRTAIARAIVSGNELILADEPTGALDSKTGQGIMDIFDEMHKQGKTIILVTHDEKVAKRAKRIIYIEDGHVVES